MQRGGSPPGKPQWVLAPANPGAGSGGPWGREPGREVALTRVTEAGLEA